MGEQDFDAGRESACGEKILGRYDNAGARAMCKDCNEVGYTAIDARRERSRRFASNKGVIASFVLLVVKADVKSKEIKTRKTIRDSEPTAVAQRGQSPRLNHIKHGGVETRLTTLLLRTSGTIEISNLLRQPRCTHNRLFPLKRP